MVFESGKVWTFVVSKDFFPPLESLTSYLGDHPDVQESELIVENDLKLEKIYFAQDLVKYPGHLAAFIKINGDKSMYLAHGQFDKSGTNLTLQKLPPAIVNDGGVTGNGEITSVYFWLALII